MSERKSRAKLTDPAAYLASNGPQFAALTAQAKARAKGKPCANDLEKSDPARAAVFKSDPPVLASPLTLGPSPSEAFGTAPDMDDDIILKPDD